jgi:hypothetical protein
MKVTDRQTNVNSDRSNEKEKRRRRRRRRKKSVQSPKRKKKKERKKERNLSNHVARSFDDLFSVIMSMMGTLDKKMI